MRNKKYNYRIWDKGTSMFLQPEINGNPFSFMGDGAAFEMKVTHPDYIVCEWTGLIDTHNNKIYEGDIVETRESTLKSMDWVAYTAGVVTWLREGFCLCQPKVGGNPISIYVFCDCCPAQIKVIGNVFETPELAPWTEGKLFQ